MKKQTALLSLVLLSSIFLSADSLDKSQVALTQAELQRVDPVLHGLIKGKSPALLKSSTIDLNSDLVKRTTVRVKKDGTPVFGVIIHTDDPDALIRDGFYVNSVFPGFVTARLTSDELVDAARHSATTYIGIGEILYPNNDVAAGNAGVDLLNGGYLNNTTYTGTDVLVCIIDSGIDFEHLDFRDIATPSQSRIIAIWDQTIETDDDDANPGEQTPYGRDPGMGVGLNHGVEYSQAEIESEIAGATFIRQADTNGHGTHVAGTVAGNGGALTDRKYKGMAPDADILVVKAGNGSFPNNFVADGLTWAKRKSELLNKPVVVNMSLGGHNSAHDGTGPLEGAVDDFAGAGCVPVISAGNEGNDNIHISGSVPAFGTTDVTLTLSYTANSDSLNDSFGLVIWYENAGDLSFTVDPPNIASHTWNAGEYGYLGDKSDGRIYVWNNTDGNYTNGDRKHRVRVYDSQASQPPASGTWTFTLTNNTGSAISYHGWLYEETMSPTLTGANSNYTIGDPGTATEAITVGSFVGRWYWSDKDGNQYWGGYSDPSDDISIFSSIGPRRDGVQKPDITASGDKVASSTSSDYTPASSRILPGQKHHVNQGTSMSSPVVAGAVALLLEANPDLTASEVKSLITSTALEDALTGETLPDYSWGYGKLDVFKAMAKLLDSGTDIDREILAYDEWGTHSGQAYGPGVKFSSKFTPTISCQVTGAFFHTFNAISISGPVYFEIWSDNGSGLPASKLGSTASFDEDNVLEFSWNFADISATGVTVTAGTPYHLVTYFSSGTQFTLAYETTSIDGNCSIHQGVAWSAWGTGDLRIRPVISSDEGVLLAASIFLEGPYDDASDEMTTALNTGGYIPTTSPYSEDARTVSSIPPDVTDWVLVQLRSTSDGAAVVSHSAFVDKDGNIVADNGTSTSIPLDVAAGSYYVVVNHRNHLSVMSASTVNFSGGTATYNFTTGLSQYYGGDAALLEAGVYGLYTGDANENEQVQPNDKNDYWWPQTGLAGYRSADFNLNGEVQPNDKNDCWWKNAGKGSQVP